MKVRWSLYMVSQETPACILGSQSAADTSTGMGQTSVGPYVVGKAAEIFLDVLYE